MATPESFAPVAITRRSGCDESVHFGAVVGLSSNGAVAFAVGDPTTAIYPRSSNKPIQAVAMVDQMRHLHRMHAHHHQNAQDQQHHILSAAANDPTGATVFGYCSSASEQSARDALLHSGALRVFTDLADLPDML